MRVENHPYLKGITFNYFTRDGVDFVLELNKNTDPYNCMLRTEMPEGDFWSQGRVSPELWESEHCIEYLVIRHFEKYNNLRNEKKNS